MTLLRKIFTGERDYRFFPAHAGDIVDIHLSNNGELFTSSTDTTIKR
ncbi:4505_t:CDS:1, partial [Paraglomus brasilianum]